MSRKGCLVAMALGAALAWLFDPDAGHRRRDGLRRKLEERGILNSSPAPVPPRAVSDYTPPVAATGL